jgi:prepilin-type processing-associated H-X9-DG protein
MGEDPRDARYVSPYKETFVSPAKLNVVRDVPQGRRRYWRWAEADNALGVSGKPNNTYTPAHESTYYIEDGGTAGNDAGANDELASAHKSGVNVLLGDGSVRFLRDNIDLRVLRGLVTLQGGEALSSDSY